MSASPHSLRKLGLRARAHFSDTSRRRGLLVAFEGPDGSGKTTQRKLFKTWLKAEGYDVVTTKWNSSDLIKPIIKSRKAVRALSPEEFSLLHAADFRHRVEHKILPALWAGQLVIADRFLFTGLARDVARGLDLDWVLKLYQPLLWPDIVFYFSVSPGTSSQRVSATRTPNYYEAGQDVTQIDDPTESYERFITRVIREYESLARRSSTSSPSTPSSRSASSTTPSAGCSANASSDPGPTGTPTRSPSGSMMHGGSE